MQTFLPFADFEKSAKCLDNKRLGKQRVETWQIYLALTKENYGWKNHPIVKMWKGYEVALLLYGIRICEEWIDRGFKDKMLQRFIEKLPITPFDIKYPSWLENKKFHDSHKSNLLRKYPEWYRKFNWDIKNDLSYVWVI